MLPDGWAEATLGDVATFRNGKAHEKLIYEGGAYIVVNSRFISTNSAVVKRTDSPLFLAHKFDTLIVMSDVPNGRAIAKCFLVDKNDLYTVNQRIGCLTPQEIDSKILFYALNRNAYFLAFDDGLKQTNLRKDQVLNCPILLPPKGEQQKIADILSTWDEAIKATEALLDNAKRQKRALMQQLLSGKRRFPEFQGQEWKEVSLGDAETQGYFKLGRGKVISKKQIEATPGDFPIYSSSVVGNGYFGSYGHYEFDEELITWSVDGGGHIFHRPHHKFSVTNVSGWLRADTTRIDYRFLAGQLQYLHARKTFDYQLKAHPSVIRKVYTLSLPSVEEQRRIGSVLALADEEIERHGSKLGHLKIEKKSLMQQLLTGKRRVKIAKAEGRAT